MLVTALEASSETVPSWGSVVERLRYEEKKMTSKSGEEECKQALTVKRSLKKKQFTCHFCGKPGHFKKDCRLFAQKQSEGRGGGPKFTPGQSAHLAEEEKADSKSEEALVSQTHLVVSKQDWLVDSGATCHMCHDKNVFRE